MIALAVLLALAWLAQPALGQDLGSRMSLHPSPAEATAEPGESALFRVEVESHRLFEATVRFAALDPQVGWTYDFQPFNLTVPAGGTANTTLVLNVPEDALVNQTYTFRFEARDTGTDIVQGTASVNVTIVAPPTEPAPPGPSPPRLSLSATEDEARPGEPVRGTLTLLHADPARETLSVTLALSGPAPWGAQLRPEDSFRTLHRGEPAATVPLHAVVPTEATEGTVQDLLVTATVDGHTFEATWRVTVLAPAEAPAEEPAEAPASNATGTPESENEPTIGTLSLSARIEEPNLTVEVGGDVTGTLRLANTGDLPLHLHLSASVADSWPVAFEANDFELAPDAVREIVFTVSAPADVLPGGRGNGVIYVNADENLVRSVAFDLVTTFSSRPVEQAPETRATAPDLKAEGDGTPAPTGQTVALVAGLGVVGVGLAAVARRPTREKLIWAAVGLYTRLARPDILGHEERERLHRIVETQPGIHFHALQRDLAWNTGTLTYHLRVLEKHGFLVSRRDGLYRRFYVQGAQPRKDAFGDGPTGLRADVLEAIRGQHGMSQSDLALALGANKQTVNYHVKALERSGLIRIEKRGRETFLFPADAPGAAGATHAEA